MERTISDVLRTTTQDYLEGLDVNNPPHPEQIEMELLDKIRFEIEIENSGKPKNRHWRIPTQLPNSVIATVILALHNVRKLIWAGEVNSKNCDLVIYQDTGEQQGIYLQDDDVIKDLINTYSNDISERDIDAVMARLNRRAPLCKRSNDPDLIAVNNGIFDYKNKCLLPFTPELVFTSKSGVNYNPLAVNTVIRNADGTDWDIESWIADLSDDEGVPELLWQMLGAIIRPNVKWERAVCLYSEKGSNGKGTLCVLLRNLCGKNSHDSINFADFADRFMLEPLQHISAIITDENDVNEFAKVASALKAVITNDVLRIDRKHQKSIIIQFKGIMVQCINSLPKFNDRTDSLYRRFLMVPFKKCFTGMEREYIKNDYLWRQDVLEYVLYRILNTDYYKFSEPAACVELKEEYKTYNDPIRQFIDEVMGELVWDLVPYQFLYDLYKSWYVKNNPSGKTTSKTVFLKQLKEILANDPTWIINDATSYKVNSNMNATELMIYEYNLTEWMSKLYKGSEPELMCKPTLKATYRGLKRS